LLVVAFDIVLAGCIAPLFAAIYWKNVVTPGGALAGILFGSILRTVLEYALPKDGFLIIPHGEYSYDYGSGQAGLPSFIDAPTTDHWNPDTCDQPRFEDWTGLDSLVSPIAGLVVMFAISLLERLVGGSTVWCCFPPHWLEPTPAPDVSSAKSINDDSKASTV
ncbi:unnamed protein product, partial [Choristocarpus tenellus]